jgi:ectoine hydroxylase
VTPEQVLGHPARVLTDAQLQSYFQDGYMLAESLIPADIIDELNRTTDKYVEASRSLTESDENIDIGPGHSAEKPVVRRLKRPDAVDDVYWRFATGVIADVAADLLGPDVCFHHSKLNFKWSDGHDEVKWHQDIPFYPHTNYGVLAIGTYLSDVAMDDGPLGVIPGSHTGPIYEHFNERGVWTGALRDGDAERLQTGNASYMPGPKGSITVHHSRAVHGSRPTHRANGRPLLINAYSAADAFPYTTPKGTYTAHNRAFVRGQAATWAHHDPEPCPVPPDWSAGYTSIYAQQAGEDEAPTPRDPGVRL